MFKRILLFVVVNIGFIITITGLIYLLERFLGIQISGNLAKGYTSVAIYALVVGFASAFFSLLLSRPIAKWTYGVELLAGERLLDYDQKLQLVYATVDKLRKAEGIDMPEVGYYDSPEPNAFATGATKNSALVAVSTGLLDQMNAQEIEGVIGHEMAHIFNGDMVTMTLVQGVLNAVTIFIARVAANILASAITKEEKNPFLEMVLVFVLEIVLGLLASIVIASYSRLREYKADEGSAKLVGKSAMVAALKKLKTLSESEQFENSQNSLQAMQIASYRVWELFSTHPALEKRIAALETRYDLM